MFINLKQNKIYIILTEKNYDSELINYVFKFLPDMIGLFGKEKVISFFREYTLIPRSRIENNSGFILRTEKIIEFDWSLKSLHEALNLLFHEVGHAMGTLMLSYRHFLTETYNRDAFLIKIEEAVVSEKQDELERQRIEHEKIQAERKAREDAKLRAKL